MPYRLPKNIKPHIDMLGDAYIQVPPEAFEGRQQPLLDAAFKSAKAKMFQAGHGFPHISTDDVDIRAWPGRNRIAVCFGVRTLSGITEYVFMTRLEGDKMLDWMRAMRLIQEQTVH